MPLFSVKMPLPVPANRCWDTQRDNMYLPIWGLYLCSEFSPSYNELIFKEHCSQPEGIGIRLEGGMGVWRCCPPLTQGDTWPCLDILLTVITQGLLLASSGVQWIEDRDAAKHPIAYRTAPHNKELSAPNVTEAEAKKSSPKVYALLQKQNNKCIFAIYLQN